MRPNIAFRGWWTLLSAIGLLGTCKMVISISQIIIFGRSAGTKRSNTIIYGRDILRVHYSWQGPPAKWLALKLYPLMGKSSFYRLTTDKMYHKSPPQLNIHIGIQIDAKMDVQKNVLLTVPSISTIMISCHYCVSIQTTGQTGGNREKDDY